MLTGCVFDSFKGISDGVCVVAYTPKDKLRPDTIVPDAFCVNSTEGDEKIDRVIYYPGENKVKVYLENKNVSENSNLFSDKILTLDGKNNNVSQDVRVQTESSSFVEGLGVVSAEIYQNGVPVRTLAEKVNCEIRVMISNNAGQEKNGYLQIADESGKVILKKSVTIPANTTKEVSVFIRDRAFKSNRLEITVL